MIFAFRSKGEKGGVTDNPTAEVRTLPSPQVDAGAGYKQGAQLRNRLCAARSSLKGFRGLIISLRRAVAHFDATGALGLPVTGI